MNDDQVEVALEAVFVIYPCLRRDPDKGPNRGWMTDGQMKMSSFVLKSSW